jgi:hypothetical protein
MEQLELLDLMCSATPATMVHPRRTWRECRIPSSVMQGHLLPSPATGQVGGRGCASPRPCLDLVGDGGSSSKRWQCGWEVAAMQVGRGGGIGHR